MTIPGVFTSPAAWVAGGTVLGALATYAAPKISKGIKERRKEITAEKEALATK
jgi:hypothetical protein